MHRTQPESPTVPSTGRPALAGVVALDGVVVTAAGVEAFDCPVCGEPRDLVRPLCDDGHDDCPDRACAVCGLALTVATLPAAGGAARRRTA